MPSEKIDIAKEVIDMEKIRAFDLLQESLANWICDYLWTPNSNAEDYCKCLAYIVGIIESVPNINVKE